MAKAKKLFTIGYEQTPPKPCSTNSSRPGSSCWSTCARSPPRAGPAFPRTSLPPGSTSAASHTCICAGSARRRKAARPRAAAHFELLHKIYAKHLKTPQASEEIDELSALVKQSGPVCILCYERDHLHCHRQWIAEIIQDRDGVKVENLAGKQM